MQANIAYEWEFRRNTSLTVTYLFVDGNDLPRSIDRNLGSLSARTFTRSRLERHLLLSFPGSQTAASPTSRG